MTTKPDARYETRYYQPEDESQVLELLRASLGEPDQRRRTSEFWRWKHFDNPFGPSLIRVAVDPGGRIIGLRAFLRWRFLRGDQIIQAMRPVDTATHPAWSGITARENILPHIILTICDSGTHSTLPARALILRDVFT